MIFLFFRIRIDGIKQDFSIFFSPPQYLPYISNKFVPKYKSLIINDLDNYFLETCSILIHLLCGFDTMVEGNREGMLYH